MWNQRQQQRERNERLRGWIIYFLYQSRPRPLEMPVLMRLLDRQNYPLTRRRLAEEVDYLRSLRLLRVFNADAEQELDDVKQAKLCQRYADSESDEEMGYVLCSRITTAGVNWQDGIPPTMDGLSRIE